MSRHVIIVGGGAAGTLVAIHLARHACEAVHVTVVEPRPRLGEGVAYSTIDEAHLLNVAASGMSIYADDAEHFVHWAHCTPDDFVPRRRYAEYLRDELARQLDTHPDVTFRHVRLPAFAISSMPAAVDVVGERLVGDAVVIALGNAAPTRPAWLDAVDTSRVVRDPWAHGALDRIADGSRVLCIGTGLTFVDVALTLTRRDCRVTAISRHGMLPSEDAPTGTSHVNPPRSRRLDKLRGGYVNNPTGVLHSPHFAPKPSTSGVVSATRASANFCDMPDGIGMCTAIAWHRKLPRRCSTASQTAVSRYVAATVANWAFPIVLSSSCCAQGPTTTPPPLNHRSPRSWHEVSPAPARTAWASIPMPTLVS